MWLVPSPGGHGKGYVVRSTDAGYTCDCPDFEFRRSNCKHIYAVCLTIVQTQETTKTATIAPDGAATLTETVKTTKTITVQVEKRPTYPQNWPAYNAAQTGERPSSCACCTICARVSRNRRSTWAESGSLG